MGLHGARLLDVTRSPVGRVTDVLLDPATRGPRWLQVRLDADPSSSQDHVLVPAAAASEIAPGEVLVPYDGATIRVAVHRSSTPLTEADAARLDALYGFGREEPGA